MNQRLTLTGLLLLALILLVACTPATSAPAPEPSATHITAPADTLRVALLLARGGPGDKSFNDSALAGIEEAAAQYGIKYALIEFSDETANVAALRGCIEAGYALIIAVGFENVGAIQTLAAEYPDTPFALIDAAVDAPNVASFTYREQEGDFIMGALAALLTESGTVGFVGGADIPITRRIEAGFTQGVAFQNPEVVVLSEITGSFADEALGEAAALSLHERGADLIYNAAGRTGLGVIAAAPEAGFRVLGTSGDQRDLAPGFTLGNRPKRVDTAVLTIVGELVEERFTPGLRSLGLAEGGLQIGPFDESAVTPEMLARLEEIQAAILSGEISISVPEE